MTILPSFIVGCFSAVRRIAPPKSGSRLVGVALALATSVAMPGQTGTALVRRAPHIDGTVDGSLQQVNAENVNLSGHSISISGDLLVPGTPTVSQHGRSHYGGTIDGVGATEPSNYRVMIGSGVSLRHVIRRTDPVALPVIAPPDLPVGTRDLVLRFSGDGVGDFSTLRDLTLRDDIGQVMVPPGTYGNFSVNDDSVLVLGVPGSLWPAVYNLQGLSLIGGGRLTVVGPVIINLAKRLSLDRDHEHRGRHSERREHFRCGDDDSFEVAVGSPAHPEWLTLNLATGGLHLHRDDSLHGYVTAPAGEVELEDHSVLVGGVTADRLQVDDRSTLTLVNRQPIVALTAPIDGATSAAFASIELQADAADYDGSIAGVEFYQGDTLIGTSVVAPYHFTWSNVAAGTYVISAKATDNLGASTLSAPVTINVTKAAATVSLGGLSQTYDGAAKAVLASTDPIGLTVSFSYDGSAIAPTAAGSYAVVGTVDDANYSGSATGTLVIAPATPMIIWNAPDDIVVGASLSSIQLNATASVPGTFTYLPPVGTVLNAGPTQVLSATFAPADSANYTAAFATTLINVLAPVPATITFDGASSATNLNATTSLSWTHVLAAEKGSGRALIVGVVSRGSAVDKASVSSVTFNGIPMISLDASIANAGSGTINRSQQFYLLDAALPPAGTYNVQVNFLNSQSASNNPLAGAISLTNVDQTAPAGYSNFNTSANAITTTVPATVGSWVVDTVGVGSTKANLAATAAGMVTRFVVTQTAGLPTSDAAGATKIADTAGAVTMSWSSASARQVHSLAVFSPALSIPAPPTISIPPASQTVNVGANVSLSVTAVGTAPLSYQWYKDNLPIPGANAQTYLLTNVQTGASGSYTVRVSNTLGHVTSGPAVLVVNLQPPVITTQPASQMVNLDENVSLSVVATGTGPLSYQWYKETTPIPDATASTLLLPHVLSVDGGNYHVTVTNLVKTVTSDTAVITVNTAPVPPVITKQPASQSAGVGSTVTFTVVVTGTQPIIFQWQKDNVDLPSSNSPTLTLSNVQLSDAGTYRVLVGNLASDVTSLPAALTVNPITTATPLYNLTGFATLGAGTTGGGVVPESDATYRKVTNALELAQALKDSKTLGAVKVIEIMNDLDLGWNEIGSAVQTLASSPFRAHNAPKLHPALIAAGVSLIDIQSKPGLTIFSANGATIRHATFNLKGTSNIVIRNLKFDEMWEWDEATKGNYDSNDWDFIDLSNGSAATNIWIDYCTFTKAYDGIMDMKAGTQYVTMSWCKYVGDDGATNANSFVRQQIAALESNQAAYPFYGFLRANGFSQEDIVQIIQGHDKAHLMGSNSLDAGNATLSATFHHQWFMDIWDRCVPRLRAGQVHNYNIFVDDAMGLVAKRLRDARVAALSAEALATFNSNYSFNPFLNGSISTEGGAILVEKSIYLDCLTPLRNNQTDVTNAIYTGKIKSVDSIYMFHEADGTTTTQRGDSTDAGSRMGPDQAAIIPFSWNTSDGSRPYPAPVMDDPADLEGVVGAGAGAGRISWDKINWLKTTY